MPLVDIELSISETKLPDSVTAFLDEADRRIDRFLRANAAGPTGFVPSDFVTVFHALRSLADTSLATGHLFCEWGSGFGIVAALASMLEYDASGIEIEHALVDEARSLATEFDLAVEFAAGSFIPPGGDKLVDEAYAHLGSECFWLITDAADGYEELGLEADDFDIIFAYPWPNEEHVLESLFERYAADGALLLTYNQYNAIRLQRKAGRRRSAY